MSNPESDSGSSPPHGGSSFSDHAELPEGLTPRRGFLSALSAVGAGVTAIVLIKPLIRYVLYPLHARNVGTRWSDLGPAEDFQSVTGPVLKTITTERLDGWRKSFSQVSVYVTKRQGQMVVLSAVCPHLGCEVAWHAQSDRFICPCHGGTFASSGSYIAGPPRRSMDWLPTKISRGHLWVKYEYFESLVSYREVLA